MQMMSEDDEAAGEGVRRQKKTPSRDRPQYMVERRNARERRRVQAVNMAFAQLRKIIPIENRNKRVSKVKTLQKAIDYIVQLRQILCDVDEYQMASPNGNDRNDFNNEFGRWINQKSCNENCVYINNNYVNNYNG